MEQQIAIHLPFPTSVSLPAAVFKDVTWLINMQSCITLAHITAFILLKKKYSNRWMLKWKLQYFGHLMQRADSSEKILRLGKIEGEGENTEEKGMTEDKMVGWHHWLSGHEFKQTLRNGEGQGSLVWCSPWGHKELDMTEWLNNSNRHT